MTLLKHNDANIYVEKIPNGKSKIHVDLTKDLFMPIKTCETSYPVDLINKILDIKGPNYLCDEIMRDESPDYVQKSLKYDLLSYMDYESFKDMRLLDFGCGSGASTMILARMFPDTKIVGVELEEKLLSVAQQRANFYGYKNIELMISPTPNSLPSNIGIFDTVVLSAVYEHLLPNERETILFQIWSILKPGGILFLNQTPYRYFPIESHTTSGLLFINYLPDNLAYYYAKYFSKRKLKAYSWEILLRKGIRGGNVKEILNILNHVTQNAILLVPTRLGIKDRIDLWYEQSDKNRFVIIKKLFLLSAKLFKKITGAIILPSLSLAIKKGE